MAVMGYKLFRQRPDGSLSPLFMGRDMRLPLGQWMKAEDKHRKGFAHRPGWHACYRPVAPHLQMQLANGEKRVWCRVSLVGCQRYERPESQGGAWVLAQLMRIDEVIG